MAAAEEPVSDPNHQEEEPEQESTRTKKKHKKRKRDKEKEEENQQEPVAENTGETIKTTLQFIDEHPDKTLPLVGYFPSGYNPHSNQNQEPNEENDFSDEELPPKVSVYRNMNERMKKTGRMELVVSPPGSNVDFVGTSYSGEAMAPQYCQYSVGVFDKESRTLKIIPVACNKIFRLEPRVRGLDYAADKEAEKVENPAEHQADMRAMLDTRYGTKKSLRQTKKKHALNKEHDPESQKALETKLKSVKMNKEALEGSTSDVALNIPPYNCSATTPEQAYPLEKIILKGEWDYLLDVYELSRFGSEVTRDSYPSFVCNRIHKLQEIQNEDERKTLACIFSYITHLVKFKDQNSMDAAASAKNHRIPNILRQKFLARFSDPNTKRLPEDRIHLLISYVLVLALHADEFRTSPKDIAMDLRMSDVELRNHFEKLGCKFSRKDNTLFATLPVPIEFPKIRQRRRQ